MAKTAILLPGSSAVPGHFIRSSLPNFSLDKKFSKNSPGFSKSGANFWWTLFFQIYVLMKITQIDQSQVFIKTYTFSARIRTGWLRLTYSPARLSCTRFTLEPGARRFVRRQDPDLTNIDIVRLASTPDASNALQPKHPAWLIWSECKFKVGAVETIKTNHQQVAAWDSKRYTAPGLSNTVATRCYLSSLSVVGWS